MAVRVTMSKTGRLTLPASIRKLLRLEGDAEFEVEQSEDGETLVLRPVLVIRRDDAWAYTPEHLKRLAEAHLDSREGRVQQVTEEELDRLLEGVRE